MFFSIAVADSDGLADVREVYFRTLPQAPSTKTFLFDDGGMRDPGTGLSSGDLLAGDGVFSRILQVDSSNTPGLRQLVFQASDTFGDTSRAFSHYFLIRIG